uniref:NADP-dependent oxidoreductase domain-containing protein n=1 Tax=Rhodosorus marinus TaxID=101924 RepID=A0A7S0BI05_9RHOD|mmetsp:Transcript_16151/g.23440  ORF Transcript_16151/g.23440 Transcript_16151/m.23440 type:complete len:367 (+) Transcript_16151:202-1302(+)|eukprot:CAMPEP_0184749726 /NCGR_PEP_ID=MMETSP0315-20130426/30329_1 /TAXON_ID=101924 /ORGANISM="Rhodosorus marinus, Strain UTEX LB 2760" /LENGTH=366 /DNA_ID=CAMNT_0027227057 /DNA_START=97 /DNA_END=1197 /DNA_ORIENTATION=-
MKSVKLGSQGLEVSMLGYGCMGLTTAYGPKQPETESIKLLKKSTELGMSFWDTANVYCYPDMSKLLRFQSPVACQEEILGRALTNIGRENVTIATKTGLILQVFPKISLTANGDPSFIRKQCEMSLKRLKVDYLDLFYIHRIDPKIPIEITMATMRDLVHEGKVKYVGLSECSAATLRRAHKVHPISCIQMEWSLWCREIEKEIVPTCAELGVGIVAYSPLGRGFFGGELRTASSLTKGDFRKNSERFQEENFEKNLALLAKVEELAGSKGVSSSQLALAWLLHKADLLNGAGLVPIPGTTKEKNLISNASAINIVLSAEEIKTLEQAVEQNPAQGARGQRDLVQWENDKNPSLSPSDEEKYGIKV